VFRNVIAVNTFHSKLHESNVFLKKKIIFDIYISKRFKSAKKNNFKKKKLKKLQNIISIAKTNRRLFLQLKSAFEDFLFFYLNYYIFMFLDCFDMLMLKINFFKNKKYYFNTFSSKIYLKK